MTECIYRIQHFENISQKWRDWFKTEDYRYVQEAIVQAEKTRKRMEKENAKADRDWTDKGYGNYSIPYMRVVEICDGRIVKKLPATIQDRKNYKEYIGGVPVSSVYEK